MAPTAEASSPKRSWESIRKFYENSQVASPIQTASTFHIFRNFPSEIRLQIWRCAIAEPRIVEIKNRYPPLESPNARFGFPPIHEGYEYYSKRPPPFLSACREARDEAVRAYRDTTSIAAPLWIRLDYDIVHLKSFAFSHKESLFRQGASRPGVNRWTGRPSPFEKIRCLAIHRELQLQTERYNCDDMLGTSHFARHIPHFFPNLELLIILIDDEYDIDHIWKVKDGNYGVYETGNAETLRLRQEFMDSCIYSFYDCKTNRNYERYIVGGFRRIFAQLANHNGYRSPMAIVMGCTLPESNGLEAGQGNGFESRTLSAAWLALLGDDIRHGTKKGIPSVPFSAVWLTLFLVAMLLGVWMRQSIFGASDGATQHIFT